MELRQIATLRHFSRPVAASGLKPEKDQTDVVTLGTPVPEAPQRPLVQHTLQRLGPLQGALTYLVGRSKWQDRYPVPQDELAQAMTALRAELAEGPVPTPVLTTLVDLVKARRSNAGQVGQEVAKLLGELHQAGRLEVLQDGQPASELNINIFARVENGQLLQSKTGGERFQETRYNRLRTTDPAAAEQYLSEAVTSEVRQRDFSEMLKDPKRAEPLKPYAQQLMDLPRRSIETGGLNANHEDLVLVQTLSAFPDQDPKVVAAALGPILQKGVETSLAIKYAVKYLGASWVIDQLAQRDPILPRPEFGLRDIQDRWTPNREDVGKVIGLLQVPPSESVLVGPSEGSVRNAVVLLGQAPPEMLEGWSVGSRDFRDVLLERLVSDRTPENEQGWALSHLAPYYPYPYDSSGFMQKTLGKVLFSGPQGEQRRDRALQDLSRGLAGVEPGGALPARELFLAGLLLGSRQGRAFEERLLQVMEPHTAVDSPHRPSQDLRHHLRGQALWHQLEDLSPKQTLETSFDTSRLALEQGGLERFLLRRWAEHVSAEPTTELKNALHTLSRGETTQALFPLFRQALTTGRLQEAFGMLEQACQASDSVNGPRLFAHAALDRVVLPQELTGYAAAQEIFKTENTLSDDIWQIHEALRDLGPRREAVTQAARVLFPLVMDQPDKPVEFVQQLVPICGDLEGPALQQRLDRFTALQERQYHTFSQPAIFWQIEQAVAGGEPAERALSRYQSLDDKLGYPHTDATYPLMHEAAMARGGNFSELDDLFALHQSLKPGQSGEELAAAFQDSCKRLQAGEELRTVREGLLGIRVTPDSSAGSGLQDTPAGLRLPGVTLRKRT